MDLGGGHEGDSSDEDNINKRNLYEKFLNFRNGYIEFRQMYKKMRANRRLKRRFKNKSVSVNLDEEEGIRDVDAFSFPRHFSFQSRSENGLPSSIARINEVDNSNENSAGYKKLKAEIEKDLMCESQSKNDKY